MNVTISFIGILLGVALFIYLSFQGFNLTLAAGFGAVLMFVFSGVNIVRGLSDVWVLGTVNVMKSYFLIFLLGGIFGKIMDVSGGAKALAYAFLKQIEKVPERFKPSFCVYLLVIMYAICVYVGIHGVIVVFTVLPIGRELFHDKNIPWRFYCYGSSGCTLAYYLSGSMSSVPNFAAAITGARITDAFGFSVVLALVYLLVDFLVIHWDVSSHMRKGEGFFPGGEAIWALQMETGLGDHLPKLWQALTPMVTMIILAAWGFSTVTALIAGCIAALVVLRNKLLGKYGKTLSEGASSVFGALINVCSAAALGTVMRSLPGFAFVSGRLDGISPFAAGLFLSMFGTALLGSCGAGIPAFGDAAAAYFTQAGIAPAMQYKLLMVGSNWLYPPHNTGIVNASATGRIPYKESVLIYMKTSFIPSLFTMAIAIGAALWG